MARPVKMEEELTSRSRRFWYGLFALLDADKARAASSDHPIVIPFDSFYSLAMDDKSVWIFEVGDPSNKCSIKRNQKDDFPYCKLLDWYLKESYINHISR